MTSVLNVLRRILNHHHLHQISCLACEAHTDSSIDQAVQSVIRFDDISVVLFCTPSSLSGCCCCDANHTIYLYQNCTSGGSITICGSGCSIKITVRDVFVVNGWWLTTPFNKVLKSVALHGLRSWTEKWWPRWTRAINLWPRQYKIPRLMCPL